MLDRVSGTASDGLATWTLNASSGPSGENPSGSVTFLDMVHGRLGQGTVGCLSVNGNSAVVGYTGQEYVQGVPGPRMTVYAWIVDYGTPDKDTVVMEQGELTDSPDCDVAPSGAMIRGDFTVTDAQPPS